MSFLTRIGKKKGKNSPKIDRITAEDMLDQGYSCEEIAESLNSTKEDVYIVKQGKQRREARLQKNSESDDSLKALQLEIKKLELEQKVNEVKWQKEDREAERADELAGSLDLSDNSEDPYAPIIQGLLMGMMKKQSNPAEGIGWNNAPVQGGVLSQPIPSDKIELNEEEIDGIVAQFPQYVEKLRKIPDSGIIKLLKHTYPNFTEQTYKTALDCIKKKEITR